MINTAIEQFYKTTKEYLLETDNQTTQTKPRYSNTHTKIHYIKEGPFKNTSKVAFK